MSDFFTTVERVFATWHYDHPRILYALMRSLKPKVAVEIGTYRGYAACYMAQALKENGEGHLYCIDDFSEGMQKKYDQQHWLDNLKECEVQSLATLIVGKSDVVEWPKKIDFAYIDGWHSYHTVLHDFLKCAILGAEYICFDDTTTTVGPMKLVNSLDCLWESITIDRDCGLTILKKKSVSRPRFSQELPNHPGVDLSILNEQQRAAHFAEATRHTGLNYEGM